MPRKPLELLSFGVLIVIVAVNLVAFFPRWEVIFPSVLALFGVWVMVTAGIRARSPEKYERGAFSTFAWGILLTAIGGAWFLSVQGLPVIYAFALVLIVIGVLAVTAALRVWRK